VIPFDFGAMLDLLRHLGTGTGTHDRGELQEITVSRSSDLVQPCVTMQGVFGSCNLNKLVSGRYYSAICSTRKLREELNSTISDSSVSLTFFLKFMLEFLALT
jgi:hypothetical protein